MEKKFTKASLKSFVKKNFDNLLVKQISDFDGMQDCVVHASNPEFRPVQKSAIASEHTLGVQGLWLVGSSRDYLRRYEANGLVIVSVSNACGRTELAVPQDKYIA
jgi:hypothetical protein